MTTPTTPTTPTSTTSTTADEDAAAGSGGRPAAAPGPRGDVEVRVYEPAGTPRGAFVWNHGGAFVAGDLDMPESDAVADALRREGFLVVAVGYRLAGPGSHHPVPSDDVVAAWRWGRALALGRGVPADRVQLGGASAGGNLVAGAVLRLLAGEGPVPAGVVLAYPTLHDVPPEHSAASRAALERLPADQRWSPADVAAMYAAHLGEEATGADPVAVPGRADVTGFPPTFVLTSEADGLRSSADEFVHRLAGAGTPVLAVCEPATEHGHLNRVGPQFLRSVRRIATWLEHAEALAGTAGGPDRACEPRAAG